MERSIPPLAPSKRSEEIFNMKRVLIAPVLTAAVTMAFVWLPAPTVLAALQTATAGSVPRMPDGHPDLSGVWWRGSDIGGRPAGDAPTGARGAAPGTPQAPPPSF